MTIHVVQPGETLYSIAGRYGADPELLRQANGVPENGALAVGQTLVIQEIRLFHVVQPGQTLASIARQYGISQRALYRNNYWLLGDPALQPGQTLVIAYGGEKLGGIFTNGYAYPFIRPRELSAVLPYMTYVTPFTYGITAQGGLLPLDDGRILSEAARLGTAPLMHLSTLTEEDNFSSDRAVLLLSDRRRQEELITQIEVVIAQKGYQGVDVDFEYIPGAQREVYAAFIARLRERIAPLPVLVALAPKTWADQPGLLYEGHDYALLGAAADYVLLMTYEWRILAHNRKSSLFASVLSGICTHIICAVSPQFKRGTSCLQRKSIFRGWFDDTDQPSRTRDLQRLGVLFLFQKIILIGRKTSMTNQQRRPPIRQYQGEAVTYIPLTELHPFPDQPFKVREDRAMQETVESIREYGVLTPAIVRPRESGGYEIVSGHRRKHACELAGADVLPAIVRNLDDDAAIILLVDSNIQREEILPSERAQALKMKLDAIKRQGARTDLTSTQVAQKLSAEKVGAEAGISRDQVRRYVRITELSSQLQKMVDEKQLSFNSAVELSYLMPDEQARVSEAIESAGAAPSISQAQKMKKLSQAGELNVNTIHSIMEGENSPPPISPPAVPYDLGDKQYTSFAESIADLKNNDKDCSCTPDQFLAEFTGFVRKFHKEINWFHMDYYEAIFPALTPVQLDYLRQQMDEIRAAVDKLYDHVKGM